MVPDEHSNASDLIEKASRALAQAKSEGKNRNCRVITPVQRSI
ncbi:hypothetical protein Q0F98_34210 [Paenibacillus amylolyticus]|nr:hypothetical protein Q0F98_34210 [Paenibacillus amylolyticus]